jgi:hypothetical protein
MYCSDRISWQMSGVYALAVLVFNILSPEFDSEYLFPGFGRYAQVEFLTLPGLKLLPLGCSAVPTVHYIHLSRDTGHGVLL